MDSYRTARLMQEGVTYPVIVRPHNQILENRINRIIRETAEELLPSGRYRTMNIITAASEYETTVNKNEILSIRFETIITLK